MIDFIITSSVCLTLFLAAYHLLLEKEKMHTFNRFYLLSSIVISLLIPFLNFEIIKEIPVVQNIEAINTIITSSAIPEIEIQENSLPLKEKINFIPYILWSLYGIISFILILRFGKNISELVSKTNSNPKVKYQNANLVLIDEKILPHTFLNSIFINSEDFNNRNIEKELFTHELVHVSQKHTIDILFIEFLKVIFWFNPLYYSYKKAIQLNHEFIADDEIVKTYNNIPFYKNLILQKTTLLQPIYLTSKLNYSVTKKRLIMMTKNTSKTLATLKKITILPILAAMIYFFCVEIVAQEKAVNPISPKTEKSQNEEDKIRDTYYSGVRVILKDLRKNISIDKMYEELTLEEKRDYFQLLPTMTIANEIPESLFKKMKTKNMAIWINHKLTSKEEIQKYKRTDFIHYTYSFVHKNARTKRFPQEYQYTLYTKKYFDENLKNSHLHFSNDTIKMTVSSKKDKFNKVANILNPKKIKADTIVWFSNTKEEYNVNERRDKKVIVIDVSHGGFDEGAKFNNVNEKDLTTAIANKIKELFSNSEIEIHLTRTTDEFIELKERTEFINTIKPDLVISLHVNANKTTNKNGFELYVSDKNVSFEKSKLYAENLAVSLSKTQLKNGGLKTAPFWILKHSNAPAMVVELGYLTNENDKKYITSNKGQTEIANTIVEFLKNNNF